MCQPSGRLFESGLYDNRSNYRVIPRKRKQRRSTHETEKRTYCRFYAGMQGGQWYLHRLLPIFSTTFGRGIDSK